MRRPLLVAALAALFLVGSVALVGRGRQSSAAASLPPVPADPGAIPVRLVHAQPFTFEEPFTHWWRAEMPEFRGGYVLVLETDRDLLVRRQLAEPVLYVGDETAERINNGDGSGRLVALVPSPLDEAGEPALDLGHAPIWFGEPALPEQVDADEARRQLERHVARGGAPPAADELAQALASGGPLLALERRVDLQVFLADLVELHAPAEAELAENMRVGR